MAGQLGKMVAKAQAMPAMLRKSALTFGFNSTVKFAGTADIEIISATPTEVHARLDNRPKVQNHIGGIHACGMALLGESATGLVFGVNVPDTHVPLIKSMKIDYKRRAQGNLTAVATLTEEQVKQIRTADRGEVLVNVAVTDESGAAPIACEMIWAWVPKVRTPKPDAGAAAAGAGGASKAEEKKPAA
eukprot:m.229829 g.229829  ORF g.229829 m.229829 type:complete len:188 (-) comp17844_c0_seq1:71-634(-)